MISPVVERRKAWRTIMGFGLGVLLTFAAFGVVYRHLLAGRTAFYAVLGLGLLQILVHFTCFLDISFRRSGRTNLQLILFSGLIIALMAGGTLVIMFNLRTRMM